jgi:antitoxin (DNA-binding transcriptional repressor) of toxin-antitoxin stability system
VIVTLRGRPIAEITAAVESSSLTLEERLQRLADAGELTLGKGSPGSSHDFAPVPLKAVRGRARRTASQIILEDRD